MIVLWISNIVFPEASALLNGSDELRSGGGWIVSAADNLVRYKHIKLYVAALSPEVKDLMRIEGKHIIYYLLPFGKGNSKMNHTYESYWSTIQMEINPDIVHIHGTEFSHGFAYISSCGWENVCVSIQGLVGACSSYYYSGLSKTDICRSITPYSLIRGGIMHGYKSFLRRGQIERDTINSVQHIIGRTSWDKERVWAINPNATYHYCGEILRSVFYERPLWDYERCTPHSIFISQASYPIKGLHMILKALPIVLKHFPDCKLRIAGIDITKKGSLLERITLSDYGLIIRKLIKKYNLSDNVIFTGRLNGSEMADEYLNCNVFVCPSSIENSPNSLAEAQILGVPVVASYVGGIPDMMKGDEDHLYRFEEIEMLAYKICQIFEQRENVSTEAMHRLALKRHDPKRNTEDLLNIYNLITRER